MTRTIYVAGPMTGIPNFNFPLFNKVAAFLRAEGHTVFNPAERVIERHGGVDISADNPTGDPELAAKTHGFNRRIALKEDLEFICLHADTICLLPGWIDSMGARAEYCTAQAFNLDVIFVEKNGHLWGAMEGVLPEMAAHEL